MPYERVEITFTTSGRLDSVMPFNVDVTDNWSFGPAVALLLFHTGQIAIQDLGSGEAAAAELFKIRKEEQLRETGMDSCHCNLGGAEYARRWDDQLDAPDLDVADVVTLLAWKYGHIVENTYDGSGGMWENPEDRAERLCNGFIAHKNANESGDEHATVDPDEIPREVFAFPEIEGWCRDIPNYQTPTYL